MLFSSRKKHDVEFPVTDFMKFVSYPVSYVTRMLLM